MKAVARGSVFSVYSQLQSAAEFPTAGWICVAASLAKVSWALMYQLGSCPPAHPHQEPLPKGAAQCKALLGISRGRFYLVGLAQSFQCSVQQVGLLFPLLWSNLIHNPQLVP